VGAADGSPPASAPAGPQAPAPPSREASAAEGAAAAERAAPLEPRGNPYLAALLAWVVPGLGHVYLGRWLRGVAFCVLVATAAVVGVSLDGKLWRPVAGKPLSYLATPGAMGLGAGYFVLRTGMGYRGDVTAAGYEYGSAFLLTAGLMNVLLVLDAWDVSRGRKR